ncbi:MAG: mercury(II) reductase [Candidatus Dormibacteraeota bacterium]|nr:mercury(II) reductase [Candidatus Dormibacteraeota bacterium]
MSQSADPRFTLEVAGMTCDDCALHVAEALTRAGARDVAVDWRAGRARFSLPEGVLEQRLRAAAEAAGYRPGTLVRAGEAAAATAVGTDFDLLVVGSGSAAFAAAIRAVEGGLRVGMVEEGTLGGTCVNVGCVPSKALLSATAALWAAGHHPFAGVPAAAAVPDLGAMVAQKDELVAELRSAKYQGLVADYGFELISGHGQFVGPGELQVADRRLTARAFLIATGASPTVPPIKGLETAGFLTSTTALQLSAVPARLAVIGSSATGLELGQLFLHLGAEVTFIEVAARVAPVEEPEAATRLAELLREEGARVLAPAEVLEVVAGTSERVLKVRSAAGEETVEVDQILVAVGRSPNTGGLGLGLAGVEVDRRGAVVVDSHLRTSNSRVFAAGDVTGGPQFVYVAAYEGQLAVGNALLGDDHEVDLLGLPQVTFTSPQLASAGLTEARAREEGLEVVTTVMPLDAVPRALVNRDTRGLVKLVAEAGSGRLVGATVLAEGAGDVISAAVLAIRHGIPTSELAATLHPYLTMAESLKLAAQTFTRDVGRLSCCAG